MSIKSVCLILDPDGEYHAVGPERKKRKGQANSIIEAERTVLSDISPEKRRQEIQRYLELFGYKPEKTIIQIHISGFFNRKKSDQREQEKKRAAANRYGGTTFVVVGRTHDPSIMDQVIKPKRKPDKASPGYIGYLWKDKDLQNRAPHEILPLDFTPTNLGYPKEWKSMFATKGFMVAMHVPSSFAPYKNHLTRALYRVGKTADVKQDWDFLDELEKYGYERRVELEASEEQRNKEKQTPLDILKMRLARGEISSEEYEKLWKTLAA